MIRAPTRRTVFQRIYDSDAFGACAILLAMFAAIGLAELICTLTGAPLIN